ncbi:MAG: hypothetical protein KKH60_11150 [Proteobacteria bacterium]|nr:hypothetical protein [Pseudomonadota bacterium]MBU1137506.1 hypothetical protein [Pseudomonadota bacterium]MBU1419007.1 hypothetical protein [Pseudomonadota bacterium]
MNISQKFTSLSLISLFLIAIFTPLIGSVIQEDKTISYTEKRKLAQLPQRPANRKMLENYSQEFERYFNDQFGMREFFLKSFSRVKMFIGDSEISGSGNKVPTKNTVEGKEGWFFLNRVWDGDPISDYRNISLYSEVDLLRATLLFAARNQWLKEQGIRYLLFFAPNKHTIYSEYMPDYIVKQGSISSMDQLYDALSRLTSVEFVDLRETLFAGKEKAHLYWKDQKEKAALYYKTDSHWNGAGADLAQYEIAKRIEKMFPGLITPAKRPLHDFIMSSFTGDISLIMGQDDNAAYGPTIFTGKCSKTTREEFRERYHTTSCETGKLNSLIFHDSFYPALKPFFADYFKTTTFLWESMSQRAVLEQLKKRKIDLVIEERAERFLPFTPRIVSERYDSFWALHFPLWKKILFSVDAKQAANDLRQVTSHNVQLTQDTTDNSLVLQATTNDPIMYIDTIPFEKGKLYVLHVELESPENSQLQVFPSNQDPSTPFPDKKYSATYKTRKGSNVFYIPLFSGNMGNRLRFDPGEKSGLYRLRKFEIRELDPSSFKEVK